MHFPVRCEKCVDIRVGKKIWGAVRAVQHTDGPISAILRNCFRSDNQRLIWQDCRNTDVQHVTHTQGAATVAAHFSEGEGRLAAEIIRYVDAAGDCKIATCSSAVCFGDF